LHGPEVVAYTYNHNYLDEQGDCGLR
jgi:hypothetical protein